MSILDAWMELGLGPQPGPYILSNYVSYNTGCPKSHFLSSSSAAYFHVNLLVQFVYSSTGI
jgi:hypothetical protein